MDRSGDIPRQCVCVGRKDIQTSLLVRWGYVQYERGRFLARLDSTRHNIGDVGHSRRLGRRNSQTSTNAPPRGRSDSSKILAARRSNRDSQSLFHPSLGRPPDIPVEVAPLFNAGLLWSNDHLFVASHGTIKEIEASTGTVSERQNPVSDGLSRIALLQHGEFIAHSRKDTVTFLDTATHAQLGLIQHPQDICSIAASPDDRFLAIGGHKGKVTINSLSRINIVSILSH